MSNQIKLTVYKLVSADEKRKYWNYFKNHHYLTSDLNVAADCFIGFLWGNPVVFYGCLRYPSGSVKNAYRGHRLVVLPDYQGMGIGNRFAEAIGQFYVNKGCRFFAKTANIKLGSYRNASSLWKPTSKNMKRRKDVRDSERPKYNNITNKALAMRLCYSHEFIGLKKS
jgi:GNAT superfamily N-acetyltransferase